MTDDPIARMRAAAEAALPLEGGWPWNPLPEGVTPMLGKKHEFDGMSRTEVVGIPAEVLRFFADITPLRIITLIDLLRQAMADAEEAEDRNRLLREAQDLAMVPAALTVRDVPGTVELVQTVEWVPPTSAPSSVTPTDATDQGRNADARDPE